MSSVAKSIELLAEGDTLEAATEAAVAEASKTIDNIKNVYVDDYRALVEDGRIQSYRVHTKITFVVHDETVK
jgi:flavin-binding protein dodecin